MPKVDKKKKAKQIKQKQKQNISIVINSNNRSKRTTVPKQATSQPQVQPRNNPPVVNIMGDTRPQLGTSSNFSGLGQQNRLFANDSALEQRLTRLLNLNNDQSANLNPSLSNTQILPPAPRYRSPSPVRVKASPKGEVMDLNFFNTRRKAYEDQQRAMNDEEDVKTPSVMDVVKGKFNNLFSPKTNEMPILGATILPSDNLLDDIKQEDDDEEKQDEEKDESFEELEPIVPAGRKEWMKLRRLEKTDWAYDNQGTGVGMVQLSDDEIDNLKVADLNALYDQVMQARANIPVKRI